MNIKIFYSLAIITLIMASCMFSKQNAKKEGTDDEIKELIVDRTYMQVNQDSDFEITKIELIDTILSINVKYMGNSKDDSFELMFNGMYAKSMPPIATLFLVQSKKGDKEFVRDLKFNISKAKYSGSEKTIVKVGGWKERLVLNH